ncbi:MAG: type II toxin-antitoxin system RelE/ParE family toxin [Marinoscillum sp.]
MSKFFLTRRSNIDLLEIEDYSLRKWGEDQTGIYMDDLYRRFAEIAKNPDVGKLRYNRSFPFYMAPAREHFAIYKTIDAGIIIATVLHGRQNIEGIVRNMAVTLSREIQGLEDRI